MSAFNAITLEDDNEYIFNSYLCYYMCGFNICGFGTRGKLSGSWGKNKGRSMEGLLERLTAIGAVLFIVLAFVLNIVK